MKFEEGLKRLEEIVKSLEEGSLSLDEALNLFKEGIDLTQKLSRRLDEAEKKIEILVKGQNGELAAEPFRVEEE